MKVYFAKYIREERSTTFKNCLKNFTFNKPTSHGDFEQTFNFKKIVKIGTKLIRQKFQLFTFNFSLLGSKPGLTFIVFMYVLYFEISV